MQCLTLKCSNSYSGHGPVSLSTSEGEWGHCSVFLEPQRSWQCGLCRAAHTDPPCPLCGTGP